jgi:hypothetical protein
MMSATLANPAPRMIKPVAKTADDRELIHVDVTPHSGRVRTDPPAALPGGADGAFVDDITARVAAQGLPRDSATGTPGRTGAVTR